MNTILGKNIKLVLTLIFSLLCLSTYSREIYPLNSDWRFFFPNENSSDSARSISLPHSWTIDNDEPSDSFLHGNYVRRMFIPSEWSDKRLFIRIERVSQSADVFLNGVYVGSHAGAYTSFTLEITSFVNFGKDNILNVLVNGAYRSDMLPTSTDIDAIGGITGGASLIVTAPLTISPVFHSTDGVFVQTLDANEHKATIQVRSHLLGKKGQSTQLSVRVVDPVGQSIYRHTQLAQVSATATTTTFTIENPMLWSPSSPKMHTIWVRVGDDSLSVRTGFRTIQYAAGSKIKINSQEENINGVTLHHSSKLDFNATKNFRRCIDDLLDLGATAVKCNTAPFQAGLMDQFDKHGLLVWVDTPFTGTKFLSDIPYIGSQAFKNNGLEQMEDIILQNYNHPSVIMWGIFSCLRDKGGDMMSYIRHLNEVAKSLDRTRPTVATSNQDGDINFITDLIVWQQNMGWGTGLTSDLSDWQTALSANWSHLTHGIEYGECDPRELRKNIPGSQQIPPVYRVRSELHEGYLKVLSEKNIFWGQFLFSLYDYHSERYQRGQLESGLITEKGQKKELFYLYRANWNKEKSTIYIANRNKDFYSRTGNKLKFYASAESIDLTVNGIPVAVEKVSPGVFEATEVDLLDYNIIDARLSDNRDKWAFPLGSVLVAK